MLFRSRFVQNSGLSGIIIETNAKQIVKAVYDSLMHVRWEYAAIIEEIQAMMSALGRWRPTIVHVNRLSNQVADWFSKHDFVVKIEIG